MWCQGQSRRSATFRAPVLSGRENVSYACGMSLSSNCRPGGITGTAQCVAVTPVNNLASGAGEKPGGIRTALGAGRIQLLTQPRCTSAELTMIAFGSSGPSAHASRLRFQLGGTGPWVGGVRYQSKRDRSDNGCGIEATGWARAASVERRADGCMGAMCPPLDHVPAIQPDPPSHEVSGRRRRAEQERPEFDGLLGGQWRPRVDDLANVLGHPLAVLLRLLVCAGQEVFSDGVTTMLVARQVLGHWATVATIVDTNRVNLIRLRRDRARRGRRDYASPQNPPDPAPPSTPVQAMNEIPELSNFAIATVAAL